MRVVFLLSLDKHFGGGDYSMYKFAEAFSKLGHQVDVFYTGNKSITGTHLNNTFKVFYKINIGIRFKGRGRLNDLITSIYDRLVFLPFLAKNSDVIDFIIGYQRDQAIKAVTAGKKFNIKTVNFNFETPDWLIEKWPAWKKAYDTDPLMQQSWTDYRLALQESNLVVANSELTRYETKKWCGRNPEMVIYPGIDTFVHAPAKSKEQQIIYLGRLEENKNIHEILKALASIGSKIQLVICGTGSLEKELKEAAINTYQHVVFKGEVSEEEKWAEIEKSLFMVFPSSFEGFGMPPMEALLMGTPCICSDIPILKEVYEDKVVYFKEHDVNDLAGKIKYLLSDAAAREVKGSEGKTFVTNKFGWDKSAKILESGLKKYLLENKLGGNG